MNDISVISKKLQIEIPVNINKISDSEIIELNNLIKDKLKTLGYSIDNIYTNRTYIVFDSLNNKRQEVILL